MRYIIFFFLIGSLSFSIHAQNTAQTLRLAEMDFLAGNLSAALKKYQRVSFFEQGEIDVQCFERIGTIYQLEGNHAQAVLYFDLVKYNAVDSKQKIAAGFSKIISLILQRQYPLAQVELFQLSDTQLDTAAKRRKLFYQAIIYLEQNDLKASQTAFLQLFDEEEKEAIAAINEGFEQVKKKNKRKPKTAKILSMIVPGSGQLYAGDFQNSINSLLINGVVVLLFLETAQSTSLANGLLSFVPIFYRYYQGGYNTAADIVLLRQKASKDDLLQTILSLLASRE